ncbi:glycoside hydrolase family 88 protein [Gordoniibacillus kamchatkensis]|nr:glycoside hydrolase family 88 protein [Paenibacillus sp. VKM B-2647]
MRKEDLNRAARNVYSFMMHSKPAEWGDHAWTDWAMNIDKWDWNPGVGIIAAAQYGKAAGDRQVVRDIEAWVRKNKGQSDTVKVINSMAPYAVFPWLYEETGETFYAEKIGEIADWMIEQAPRTREGALEHTVTEKATFREQIWADTVFMAVLFLARAARIRADRRLAEEALRQVLLHLRALQDDQTGLLYHGWNCETGSWMSAARWNRANAWNAAGVPMILEEAGAVCGDSGMIGEIRERYHRLAEALAQRQNSSGLWPTVLDRPGFYEETSGSAGIAYGLYLAVRQGLAPASLQHCADRTVVALLPKIRADGAVSGVSGGTPVLESVEAYNEVPVFPTLYGQGLALLLLTEALSRF